MSEATDKKTAFNDAQKVYYNDVNGYVNDVFSRFTALKEADVEDVLFVIHAEWLERLEGNNV